MYGAELFDTARVIHQDVEAAKAVDRSVDDIAEPVDHRDVCRDHRGVAPLRTDLLCDPVEVVLGPGDQGHVGAGAGERQCDAPADALARTRYQRDLSSANGCANGQTLMPKISAALPRQICSTSLAGTPSNCFSIQSAENGNEPS